MDAGEKAAWQAADRILDRLLDLAPEQRDAALAAIDTNDAVRRRVQRLLAAHARDVGPLEQTPRLASAAAQGFDQLKDRRLGRWQLQRQIGQGGMAVVYCAVSVGMPAGQKAAIKVLTLGALAGAGRERFLGEQQALLRLRHPYIVSLYDAGIADDGTPWLAMALVEGERIDQWCDNRGLDTPARVRLMLQVGEALSYAHRNLVIHRDIKPSNVLVDDDGHVRLLDFGIARLADETDAEATATQHRALTPEYAAPEQFAGAPPSTAIDVYGMAALLYRLLTGKPPRKAHAGDAAPVTASRAAAQSGQSNHKLRGDLDTVLSKALAEAPERRYASVEAFTGDLRRWLEQRPVLARGPGWRYRASRFLVRHRFGVATAVVGSALAVLALSQIVVQRDRAEAQARRAETVRDFLADIFASTEPEDGKVPNALELLDQGSQRARGELLRRDPLVAADVLALSGGARYALSDLKGAAADLTLALSTLQKIQPAPARELSLVHHELGKLYRLRGPFSAEIDHYSKAVAWQRRWEAPVEARIQSEAALASAMAKDGRWREGMAMLRALLAQIPDAGLTGTQRHIDLLNALSTILAIGKSDMDERIALHEERFRVARMLYGPRDGWYAYTLADSVPTLRRSPRYLDRAEAISREAVAIADHVYRKPHLFAAVAYCNHAALLVQRARPDEALPYFDRTIAIDEALARNDRHAQSCRHGRAHARAALGRSEAAIVDLAQDREMIAKLGPAVVPLKLNNCGLHASVLLRNGRPHEARTRLRDCGLHVAPADIAKAYFYRQAQAEAAWLGGDRAAAARLLEALRRDQPPDAAMRYWIRPWMLSLLVETDPQIQSQLRAQLRPYGADPVLGRCLDRTLADTSACLSLR